jgi:hypothetical protein
MGPLHVCPACHPHAASVTPLGGLATKLCHSAAVEPGTYTCFPVGELFVTVLHNVPPPAVGPVRETVAFSATPVFSEMAATAIAAPERRMRRMAKMMVRRGMCLLL